MEVHNEAEVETALRAGARVIGVNNRNLKDFSVDTDDSRRLRALIPENVRFVSESGVRNGEDVARLRELGADGVLIGESLMRAADKKAALAGLRGGASIVFAIMAVLGGVEMKYDLFNLVFCIVLLSISIQGTLLPRVAERLAMIDQAGDVSKTFNDYQEESDIDFIKVHLGPGHPWSGGTLRELPIPPDLLVVMIARGQDTIVPHGGTVLQTGDLLVMAARAFEDRENLSLQEVVVERSHKWCGRSLSEISVPRNCLIVMIKRGLDTIIPDGSTRLEAGDVLVAAQSNTAASA